MWFFNKIIHIWNLLRGGIYILLFYLSIKIGNYKFIQSNNNDDIRKKYADKAMYYLYIAIKIGISPQIVLKNFLPIKLEKVTLINSNHYHQNDILFVFYLFFLNKINGSNISSISTSINITELDKEILNLENAILVDKSKNDILSIKNKLTEFKNRKYNTALITFFEGIALRDAQVKSCKLKHLLDPKKFGFQIVLNNINSKYIYDLNLVYLHNNQLINPKDKFFTFLLFHPDTKVIVEMKKYKLPDINNSDKWLDQMYQDKDKRMDNILNKYVK